MKPDVTTAHIELASTDSMLDLRDVLESVKENLSAQAAAQLGCLNILGEFAQDVGQEPFALVDFTLTFCRCADEILEILELATEREDAEIAYKAAGLLEFYGYNSKASHC